MYIFIYMQLIDWICSRVNMKNTYNKLVLVLVALLITGIYSCEKETEPLDQNPVNGNEQESIAPDFTLPDQDGTERSLYDYRGDVVLIDFWASWCGFCTTENPELVALYQMYKDKGFKILSVSLDTNRDSWLNGITKQDLPFIHVSDLKGFDSPVAKTYNVPSIPHFVLVDEKGTIILVTSKADRVASELKNYF